MIVMPAELRKFLPRVVQRREPFHIQTLVPQLTVETLDESVLHRTAWPNDCRTHAFLTIGRKANSNSAPAMTTHDSTGSQSPLMQLMTSLTTCVAMIAIANLHPKARRNQPIPVAASATPSSTNCIPTVRPNGESCR